MQYSIATKSVRFVLAVVVAAVVAFTLSLIAQTPQLAFAQEADGAQALTTQAKPSLNKKNLSLELDKTAKLKLKNGKVASWKSSDKSVVKVNKKGKVTPVTTGTAKIICTDKKGNKYKCNVMVVAPNVMCKYEETEVEAGQYSMSFEFTNSTAETVTLSSPMLLFYEDFNTDGQWLVGYNEDTDLRFDESPVVIVSNDSEEFEAVAETSPQFKTGESTVVLSFTVGNVECNGIFDATLGLPLSCQRA